MTPFFHHRCANCRHYIPYVQGRVWFHPPKGLCCKAPMASGFEDRRWGWDVCGAFDFYPFPQRVKDGQRKGATG